MIIELLESKGFVEDLDFTFDGQVLTALERTRDVEQIIHHEEVPAVLGSEGDVVVEAIPAYDEVIIVQETYLVQLPSVQELQLECVKNNDPALLIGEYLKGKEVGDSDSLNIDLFLSGGNGWRFASIPAPSIQELFDLIVPTKAQIDQDKINAEARAYLASTDWIVTRAAERGEELSLAFKAERQAARQRIV